MSYLTSDIILKNLPFFLFLGFLGTTYIASGHYAERNVRQIQHLQKEVQELRWYFMSLEADNMVNSRRIQVGEQVKREGLKSFGGRPRVIVIEE